jgi:hypothetical protein
MIFSSKRDWRRARRTYARQALRYRDFQPPAVAIWPNETRDELISRARTLLRRLAWKRTTPIHGLVHGENRDMLREIALLRTAAFARQRIDTRGLAFYVTIRDGNEFGRLYGPFNRQLAALEALPLVKQAAYDANHGQAAFAAFGTASIDRKHARPGLLNDRLPPIPPKDALPDEPDLQSEAYTLSAA